MPSTRERIQRVSLELFLEQGYEKTSLREIAERLGVTKAALYYHFKAKEDILSSYFEDFGGAVKELIAWGEAQPRGPKLRRELLRRYMDLIIDKHDMIRFFHENQPTMRRMDDKGRHFKERMGALHRLMYEPDADLETRVRAFQAIMTVHTSWFVFFEEQGVEREQLRDAALSVALGLVTANEIHMASDPLVDGLVTAATKAAEHLLTVDEEPQKA
ncbi:TetR/AcrR family transcriptional regulator [Phytomonospora endophytica]|uniref:AcrR family transcriptional regulator n=1 Tax=Phytomonospora endophytica TaxID=714109 RepID=A0A841FT21_9ACTN|nr:TetR/AcrR family transcriptional regulator [Phytomonospora endophytica]MBB6039186.1 AcrR family transcriptional regulator [Phytomonospora endophytica]GIG67577.1 TetR family transcriptional regulator [Phytomonospora endophytica]